MFNVRVTSAVLCEFCRPELGGKITIIGAMGGDILVPSMPATFPISAYFEIDGIPAGIHQMLFQLEGPEGAKIEMPAQLESPDGGPGAISMPQINLQAAQPGPLIFRMRFEGQPWIELISRKILISPIV